VGVANWQVYVSVNVPVTGPLVELQTVAVPLTVQLRVPVGAPFPAVPVTVAVKIIGRPTVVVAGGDETMLIVGVTLARLMGKIAVVAVR